MTDFYGNKIKLKNNRYMKKIKLKNDRSLWRQNKIKKFKK